MARRDHSSGTCYRSRARPVLRRASLAQADGDDQQNGTGKDSKNTGRETDNGPVAAENIDFRTGQKADRRREQPPDRYRQSRQPQQDSRQPGNYRPASGNAEVTHIILVLCKLGRKETYHERICFSPLRDIRSRYLT